MRQPTQKCENVCLVKKKILSPLSPPPSMFSCIFMLQKLQLQNTTNAFYQNINVTVAMYTIFLKFALNFFIY